MFVDAGNFSAGSRHYLDEQCLLVASLSMVNDEILMLRFQAGSRDAFDELFGRHQQALHGFFGRRLAGKGQAEDLAQETWMAVLRGIVRYEPRALFRVYLYGIAFRVLAGERRRNSRTEGAMETTESVAKETGAAELWVREALEKLEGTEREILMLREYEQLSYAEIGELLRIPINTVRSRLFRARMALKRFLEPAAEPMTAEGRS